MCRISGIINSSFSPEFLQVKIKQMCTILQHGGPDDEGFYISPDYPVVLGHRRLSLIDLSEAGHQPMSYAEERYYISFNGEIYNYLELKDELIQAGCNFRTHSDTEVILAAFSVWGTKSFSRLNGMFAFALWDNYKGRLYLVRDSMGIKPLYYAITKEGIAFASEIRALKALDYLQQENEKWQVYLMAYGHLPEPITTLQKVKPLAKGSFLEYNITGSNRTETFFYYTYPEEINNRGEALELVKDKLQKAVKRHLISDAPIGVFVSGGLDSSIIALLANRSETTQLKTLSIFFQEAVYSEKKYQDLLQENLKCMQYQHLLKEEEFHTYFPSILKAMDQPSCDGINTWFISKYARENGLKAVLSGIGGDELYGGYPSFKRMRTVSLLKDLPKSLLETGKTSNIKRWRRLAYLALNGVAGEYLFLRGQFIPNEIANVLGINEKEVWEILKEQPQLPNINNLSLPNQASWIESNMYMQNQLLHDSDVMSMAHGLEIRVPFLDKEFSTLSFNIKSEIKYSGAKGKQMLIDSFKDILPRSIWDKPKMGFSFPFREWFLNNEYIKETVASKDSSNYKKFVSGKMHWSQLLMLFFIYNRDIGNA